jgi:hypothetical protein
LPIFDIRLRDLSLASRTPSTSNFSEALHCLSRTSMSFLVSKTPRISKGCIGLTRSPRKVRLLPATASPAPNGSMIQAAHVSTFPCLPLFATGLISGVALGMALPVVVARRWYRSHLRTVPVTGRVQFLWSTEYEDLAAHNSQDWLSLHGKSPKLDKDDLVAKPVHNILDQLLKAKTAEGFKPKLYVYEDFGMRRA